VKITRPGARVLFQHAEFAAYIEAFLASALARDVTIRSKAAARATAGPAVATSSILAEEAVSGAPGGT
jgi:hypothetical protein